MESHCGWYNGLKYLLCVDLNCVCSRCRFSFSYLWILVDARFLKNHIFGKFLCVWGGGGRERERERVSAR